MKNREKLKEKRKELYLKNKEKYKEYNREYKLKNKEKLKEYQREYEMKNKEKRKQYILKNKVKRRELIREYNAKNKEILKERKKQIYIQKKKAIDPNFVLRKRVYAWNDENSVKSFLEYAAKLYSISDLSGWYRISCLQIRKAGGNPFFSLSILSLSLSPYLLFSLLSPHFLFLFSFPLSLSSSLSLCFCEVIFQRWWFVN